MFVLFIVLAISFVLMIYLAIMYGVKVWLDFVKMIEWKVLRFLVWFFTIAIVIIIHFFLIRIIVAII